MYHVYDLILKGSSKGPDETVSITFQNMMIVSENSLILREDKTLEGADGKCSKHFQSMEYGESTWFGYGNLISNDDSTHK